MEENLTRINKYISESGAASRREADRLIEEGRVRINGEIAVMGSKVAGNDTVTLDGNIITPKKKNVYLAFNKPRGIETTTDETVPDNIISYISYPERIFPVGRLDKDSTGLILLTDDGDIVNKILRASNRHEKEYLVSVDRPVTDEFIRKMSKGVPILGQITRECFVERTGMKTFRIILTQGLNRQIRRMCEFLGYRVTYLKRIRIMNIELKDLKEGSIRHLSPLEMKELNEALKNSRKHFE